MFFSKENQFKHVV